MKSLISKTYIKPSLCVISVIGGHALESMDAILQRKELDIQIVGFTLWVFRSNLFTFARSLDFSKKHNNDVQLYLIAPATNKYDKNTKDANQANMYYDGVRKVALPKELSPVTGSLRGNGATAFILKSLTASNEKLDLNDYSNYFSTRTPLKFNQSGSTALAIPDDMHNHKDRVKSNIRNVIAKGTLGSPFTALVTRN